MDHDALQTCALCHRTLSSETDSIDLDSITICGDCKFLLLEENGTSTPSQHVPRTNPRIRRSQYNNNSSDTSARTTPRRRWRRVVYDTESDDLDSLNGDGDIVSYGTYDDGDDDYDDDVSVNRRVFLGGDSDTDIDPMHAETDNSRRGAPPAAQSFVNNLDCLVVTDTDCDGLVCAICKELLTVGTAVNHLPCSHDYHPLCIKPWLILHNTCPLCRFEFPTDDVDYEDRKESGYGNRGLEVQEVQQELEDNIEEDGGQEMLNNECGDGTGGRRCWFVAAPVVSLVGLVGIGLALWLGNPGAIKSSGSRGDRIRRWWGLF